MVRSRPRIPKGNGVNYTPSGVKTERRAANDATSGNRSEVITHVMW
jgi:hypothetical protein